MLTSSSCACASCGSASNANESTALSSVVVIEGPAASNDSSVDVSIVTMDVVLGDEKLVAAIGEISRGDPFGEGKNSERTILEDGDGLAEDTAGDGAEERGGVTFSGDSWGAAPFLTESA